MKLIIFLIFSVVGRSIIVYLPLYVENKLSNCKLTALRNSLVFSIFCKIFRDSLKNNTILSDSQNIIFHYRQSTIPGAGARSCRCWGGRRSRGSSRQCRGSCPKYGPVQQSGVDLKLIRFLQFECSAAPRGRSRCSPRAGRWRCRR